MLKLVATKSRCCYFVKSFGFILVTVHELLGVEHSWTLKRRCLTRETCNKEVQVLSRSRMEQLKILPHHRAVKRPARPPRGKMLSCTWHLNY